MSEKSKNIFQVFFQSNTQRALVYYDEKSE